MTYGENRGCPGSQRPDPRFYVFHLVVFPVRHVLLIPGMLGMFILGQTHRGSKIGCGLSS